MASRSMAAAAAAALLAVHAAGCKSTAGPASDAGDGPVRADAPASSCTLAGVVVEQGASHPFYDVEAATTPDGCSQHEQSRTCSRGELSGTDAFRFARCVDGGRTTKPNIVFIMLDDAGSADFGNASFTDPSIIQPNIKAFAGQSKRFEQFYTAPMCTPTRMSQLSGQYPLFYGILWVCGSNAEYGIPAAHTTLPQTLKAAGYHTATIGKWHSGQGKSEYTAHAKFDHSVESAGVVANGYFDPSYQVDGSQTPTQFKGKHLTDVTADFVVAYINQRAKSGQPFFVNYWLNAPHSPHQPSPRWEKQYCGDKTGTSCALPLRYKALVSQADENIGKVLEAIDAVPGLREKTIVMLTSDNGGTALAHPDGNGPLRGFKTDVFEGGTHLPLYVRWPGVLAPGSTDRSLLGMQDIYPTLAELAGAPAPQKIGGKSFAAVVRGDKSDVPRGEPLFWSHKVANEHVTATAGNVLVSYAVREGPWKLVFEPLDNPQPYLFNIDDSVYEGSDRDRAAAHPDRVADLEQKYLQWLLDTSRVAVAVGSTQGSVSASGNDFTFKAPGGSVQLKKRQAFNINRLDFTFAARIQSSDQDRARAIASQPGSWALRINQDNHLELNATGKGGEKTTLVGTEVLTSGSVYDVAFTVYAFKSLDSVARLFVREVALGQDLTTAADKEIPPFASNDQAVQLGVGGQGKAPFLGAINRVNVFRAPLTKAQILGALGQ